MNVKIGSLIRDKKYQQELKEKQLLKDQENKNSQLV